jgi:hypothetical protein
MQDAKAPCLSMACAPPGLSTLTGNGMVFTTRLSGGKDGRTGTRAAWPQGSPTPAAELGLGLGPGLGLGLGLDVTIGEEHPSKLGFLYYVWARPAWSHVIHVLRDLRM